jgi:hypothetical protein
MIHSIKKFSIVKLSITAMSNDNAYNDTKTIKFSIMTLSITTVSNDTQFNDIKTLSIMTLSITLA